MSRPSHATSCWPPPDVQHSLEVYARRMDRRDGEPQRLRALVEGSDWAEFRQRNGSNNAGIERGIRDGEEASGWENPAIAAYSCDGRCWVRTSDLLLVRQAL